MKYTLKSKSLGIELPFIKENYVEGLTELSPSIYDLVGNKFELIDVSMKLKLLPSLNELVLVTVIGRFDNHLSTETQSSVDWSEFTEELIKLIESYSEKSESIFRLIK